MARSTRGATASRPKRPSAPARRPVRPAARSTTRRSVAARPRRAPARARRTPLLSAGARRELGGIVLIGGGAVSAAVLAIPGSGTIAGPLHDHLVDGLGVGAWVVAAALVFIGVRLLGRRPWSASLVGAAGCGLVAAAFLSLSGLVARGSAGSAGDRLATALGDRLGGAAAAAFDLVLVGVGLVLAVDLRVGRLLELVRDRLEERRDAAAVAGEEAPVQTPSSFPAAERDASAAAALPLPDHLVPGGEPRARRGRAGRVPAAPVFDDDDSLIPVLGLGLEPGAPPAPEPGPEAGVGAAATLPFAGTEPDPATTSVQPFRREFEGLPVELGEAGPLLAIPVADAGSSLPIVVGETVTVEPAVPEEPEKIWELPPPEVLEITVAKRERLEAEIRATIETIQSTLAAFGVDARVRGVNSGPTVTQYELQPAKGVPVRKITGYQTDLSLALAAPIRIQAPIPGKAAIGIEVPNKAAQLVTLRDIVTSPQFSDAKSRLPIALGADVSGFPVAGDLARMPHLLIAGATGSGKSVCINAILGGLLLHRTPKQLKLVLVDPKRVELSGFMDIPHLLVPVVVEPEAAVASLRWAVKEMEERYKLFAGHGARNIAAFNERAPLLGLDELPSIVIVIDELADLMMVASGEIEDLICRIAQLARAVGIHLIVATQRPSADVITGLIKANIPSRVAFAVSSGVDSRVILDEMGAEKLLGRGDMLYLPVDEGKARRLQGAYVSDRELERIIDHWKGQGLPTYQEEIFQVEATVSWARDATKRDPLFGKAAHCVAAEGRAAASLLQRKLNVGYTRAARLVDQLAEHRVVGPYEGSKSREVLMDVIQVDELMEELGAE